MRSFSFILWVGKDEKILPPKSDFVLYGMWESWFADILQWKMKMLCWVQEMLIHKADSGWWFSAEKDQWLIEKK